MSRNTKRIPGFKTPARRRAAADADEIVGNARQVLRLGKGRVWPTDLALRLLVHAKLHRGLEPLLAEELIDRAEALAPRAVARARAGILTW
jgi:hypothetical protein